MTYVPDERGLYERLLRSFFHTLFVYFVHLQEEEVESSEENGIFVDQLVRVPKRLVISRGTEMLCVPVERLVYISAEGNYSHVYTQDKKEQMVSFQLGQIEDLIGDQLGDGGTNFVRLGRGLIVNTEFVYLIDITKQRLVMSDCESCFYDLTASREVLIKLKAYIDATLNSNGR